MLQGEPVSAHARGIRSDGTEMELSIIGGPVRSSGAGPQAFLAFRDLTRQSLVDAAFHRLEQAVDTMQLGVTVTDLEGRIVYTNPADEGRIVYTNPADAAMHGYVPEELVGKHVQILAPSETHQPMNAEETAARGTWRRESVNRRKDGSIFPVHLMSDLVRDGEGRPIGVVTTCEDITERKRTEDALRESEERYALAMKGANDGLWDWNLETGKVFYSSRWKEIIGEGGSEMPPVLDTWLDRAHPHDRAALEGDLRAHREGRTSRLENEHRLRSRDGSYLWVLARGMAHRGAEGEATRITGSITDITDRKGQEERLTYEALYDPLTNLPNRAFLDDLLRRAMRRVKRQPEYTFAVLFVDLDRFKQVNDTLGHATGDRVLAEVAKRLQTCVRPGDVVTRLAGDEFCVLLDDIGDGRDATRVARRILESLDEPLQVEGRTLFTGASIGIAVSEGDTLEPEHLMRNADTAMYRAKTGGRGRFEVFDRTMHERAMELMRLEAELRRGLEEDQFHLVYLPVVRLEDRRIIGLEALLRWRNPERGEVPPSVFVPIAEETGMIVPMGWWVLERACEEMSRWVEMFPSMAELSVSVNFSIKQLRQPDLLERVNGALERSGLPPDRLFLEVSERDLMEEPEWHEEVLGNLQKLGVQVQVDDFGTGPSSLTYLDRFKISTLKIDRSFVKTIDRPDEEAAVVQAIITLARQLGIRVVAEGVETHDQGHRLMSLHCDVGQGFLFGRPMEPDVVTAVLEGERELLGA
jgi:diguanylate cyclase (GGDEF)-like protein/PAS domain S-box-containing protein